MAAEQRRGPNNRAASQTKSSAKLAVAVLALCALAGVANSQWLETNLYLPDSLSGVTLPSLAVHNSVNNKVYVTGKYGMFNRAGRDCWIVVLDGVTNRRIARIAVPSEVFCLAYNATDNKVYAASFVDSGITVIDGSADTVLRQLQFGSNVTGMYWDQTLDKLYCGHGDSSITVLAAAADTVVATMQTTCRPYVLQASPDFLKLYCGESNSSNLAIIDCAADTVIKNLYLDHITAAMCYDSVRQRVYSVGGKWISAVGVAGDSIIVARQVATGNQMNRDVELGAHGAKLYVNIADSLFVLDPLTLDRTAQADIGGYPSVMSHDPRTDRLFCTDGRDDRVFVVDCEADSVVAVLDAGVGPVALCLDPAASKAYCVNTESDDVTIVDCVGDTVVATVAVGSQPTSLCYNRTFGKLYCANSTNGLVSVISGSENRVVESIWVGYGVTSLCMGPEDAKLYCRVPSESAVAAIDCATDSVVAKMRMDTVPQYLCYVPQHNRLYCGIVHGDSGTLAAIDCATDSVVTTLALRRPPRSLTYNSAEDKLYCGAGEFYDTEVISCAGDSSLGLVAGVRAQGPTLYSIGYDKLYLSCLNRLYIVDGTADTLLAAKTAVNGNVEGAMCWNSLQQKVYVPFQAGINGSVLIIDVATDSLLKTMAAESSWALCYDSINNTVYVSDGGNFGAVKAIDCVNDVVNTRIPVGLQPRDIVWNPDQNRAYVVNRLSGSVSVLRDSFPSGIGAGTSEPAKSKPPATVIRGVLFLPLASGVERGAPSVLLDISGRRVLDLHAGANDVRSLAPGVYFIRPEPSAVGRHPSAVTKIVIAR
jgi:YVTN family beta-propeller protein